MVSPPLAIFPETSARILGEKIRRCQGTLGQKPPYSGTLGPNPGHVATRRKHPFGLSFAASPRHGPVGTRVVHLPPSGRREPPADPPLPSTASQQGLRANRPDPGGTVVKLPVKMTINGQKVSHEVEPRLLLVHYIREVVGLTGTHVGCDTSQCGACTILIDGQAVKACTLFAVQADGATITTIEGLAKNGELHPIQQGFWEKHGLQCGFCTPGMILAAYQMLERYPKPTEDQIRHQLEGNLCRCTGYHNIVKAIEWAAEHMPAKR